MPALSPTMTSGNIGSWHKKVGDEIVPGDVLVEIETDKAQMDFECQDEGFLAKVLMQSGSKEVEINKPIAILVEDKDDVAAFSDYVLEEVAAEEVPAAQSDAPAVEEKKPKASSKPTDQPAAGDRTIASPLAKKIAMERGIDLSGVLGTGPNNRIVKADVESALSKPQQTSKSAVAAKAPSKPVPISGDFTDIPLTNMRKVIATRLQESKSSIPHYYLTMEITMDKVLKLRQVFNEQGKSQYKLSVNDFIIKAAALALRQVPEVNSSWGEESIRRFNTVDISVAVATPSGLITPIVKDADVRGLVSISNAVKDMATRARENKLAPQEYQGGTFTISNLGMFGIKQFTAIINPPQSCILAIGGTDQKLVPDEKSTKGFSVVNTMNVTLSCDHRVVDGAVGSQWLAKFKEYLENPLTIML